MSTATDLDTSILTDLSFTPSLPCEYRGEHEKAHGPDAPAEWVATVICPACGGGRRKLICDRGKEQKMLPHSVVECSACGCIDKWSVFVIDLERFAGGAP